MPMKSERRYAMDQALASGRLEGHMPTAEELVDCDRMVEGTMTPEEAIAASFARIQARRSDHKELILPRFRCSKAPSQ